MVSPHKGPVMRKAFPYHEAIIIMLRHLWSRWAVPKAMPINCWLSRPCYGYYHFGWYRNRSWHLSFRDDNINRILSDCTGCDNILAVHDLLCEDILAEIIMESLLLKYIFFWFRVFIHLFIVTSSWHKWFGIILSVLSLLMLFSKRTTLNWIHSP